MRPFIIVVITALVIPFSGLRSAQAAEINTPTVASGLSASVQYHCRVTNLDTKTIRVAVDLLDDLGMVFDQAVNIIDPGVTGGNLSVGTSAPTVRCRVTGKFSKKKAIVSMQLRDAATFITLVAVEGR